MEVAGRKLETEEGTLSEVFCEPCQVENKKTKANGACRECKEYMCTTCYRHHLKAKHCRNHVLLPTGELSSMSLDSSTEDAEKCEKHDNEPIKFYCRTHEIVGCGDCIVLGHATCKPEYIKDLEKTLKNGDEFKNLMEKLKMFESYKKKNGETIKNSKDEAKSMYDRALKEIRQFRSDINIYLDNAEANILSQVEQLAAENTEMQRKLEQDVKALTSEIEEVKQKLNTQLYHGNALFINAIRCKSKLGDIEKMNAKVKQEHSVKRFEFIRDENISGILQSAQQLGKLRTDSGRDGSKHGNTNSGNQYSADTFASLGCRKPKSTDFVVGARVRRGPDWRRGNQDGGGPGTVTCAFSDWAVVRWDKGNSGSYRIGQDNAFDLEIIQF
ncbi:transcription intermediary factor 1-alpha-like [Mercenaria mercenaria]|uniref:transcription intermediary factor 1-alpha-like n=1 Tax=Mercenaria mercenaria TaxID=6596 RepID=UPI00234E8163|nr:transcription intermediary factor 1-alpha-like [Mercenaria mercenaria]